VNQWLNLLKGGTNSNLVDMGWAAVCVVPERMGATTRTSTIDVGYEATTKACGVVVARPQQQSWTPILLTGTQ
jgi:hypothetical protein